MKLSKKPEAATIITGFPGFGMVGTIAAEFLIEHLKAKQIGTIIYDEIPAVVAIHQGGLHHPYGVFYDDKYKLAIIYAMTAPQGSEWKFAEVVADVARQLKAKELISLEGVGSTAEQDGSKVFYFAASAAKDKEFKKLGIEKLGEGIIMGITSALLVKSPVPVTCIFAETHTNLPDSKAAAKLIEALDGYLDLEVDYQPLIAMAAKFEEKLKKILQQSRVAADERDKKTLSYVG